MSERDDAVRNYLTAIRDPDALKDERRLKNLESSIEATEDVLEEAKLLSEHSRLSNIQPKDYEQGFLKHGKPWADANAVPSKTFESMGVDSEVLARAGFDVAVPPLVKSSKPRKRVSRDEVVEVINSQDDAFPLQTIVDVSGASLATVRKVIADLVERGSVEDLGPDPEHSGRGRAPSLYKVKG